MIAPERLAAQLAADGLIIPTSVVGLHAQGRGFIRVAEAVTGAVREAMQKAPEHMRFASVMPRADLERIGYFRNFPHLLGTVHCFCGEEADHRALVHAHDTGEDWTAQQRASDLVMIPAACYPVYPVLAARGVVPCGGYRVQVEANCFRREPSADPIRLQSFHMHETVRIATPDEALAFRDSWLETGLQLLSAWGLDGRIEPADDPFFGRAAVVMAKSQRAKALKFELKIEVSDPDRPTACMSANYHLDSFARTLGLAFADGTTAHSACVGFGIERVSLALFRHHGTDIDRWPAAVRRALRL